MRKIYDARLQNFNNKQSQATTQKTKIGNDKKRTDIATNKLSYNKQERMSTQENYRLYAKNYFITHVI